MSAQDPSLGPRVRRALLVALGAGLALFLFVQPGNPYDEAEHLHAAWLMAVRGLRPIHDFFEHHPPLLWHVLSVPFRLGMRGPAVLYAARLLVIACAAIWSWALFAVARRGPAGPQQEKQGAFAFVLFALTALLAHQLFVTRPETLATALLGLSLLCWTAPSRSLPLAAAGGAFLALCVCASPRFALLAPSLLLTGAISGRRVAAATLAGGATVAAFVFWLCGWQELLFDLRFSALLQQVGLAPVVFSLVFLAACALGAAFIWGMLFATARVPRRAALLWGLHGALIWAVCLTSSGRFLYAQAFAPALMWAGLFAAWLEAQPAAEGVAAARPPMLLAALLGTLAAVVVQMGAASLNVFNVPALTSSRELLLEVLPPSPHVLLLGDNHPITADDASYFGAVLSSGICEAAEVYPQLHPTSPIRLPLCDLVSDLRRVRPEAVSSDLYLAAPPLQIEAVRAELSARYEFTDLLDAAPTRAYSAKTLLRKR